MKKKYYALIAPLLLSMVLVACGQTQISPELTESPAVSSTSNSSMEASQSTPASSMAASSETSSAIEAVYAPILAQYGQALRGEADFGLDQVSGQLALLRSHPDQYSGPYASTYDVDKDGQAELFIALKKEETYYIIDLYTYLPGDEPLRLVDSLHQAGPEIGEEVLLWALEDGTYSVDRAGNFSLYRYDDHIPGLKKIADRAPSVASLDIRQWAWTEIGAE